MQYWESILKNDAILEIDTKKRCNIGKSILKNDAILGIDTKKRCNIGNRY
jgi:hypothetical protein